MEKVRDSTNMSENATPEELFVLNGNVKPNLITLAFTKPMERRFNKETIAKSLQQIRIVMFFGILLYSAFGILDYLLLPELRKVLWIIRYNIFLPFGLAALFFTYTKHFYRWIQVCLTFLVLLAGSSIIVMVVIAPPPISYSYYAGILLVIFFGSTLLRIRFLYVTIIGWTLVVLYEIAAVYINPSPTSVLINNNFFFISATIIGMVAAYFIEYSSRRDFINTLLLEQEKDRVKQANLVLEEKVQERTAELSSKNKELELEIGERKKTEKIQNVLFNISQMSTQTETIEELIERIRGQVNTLMDAKNFYVALVQDRIKGLFSFPYIVDINPEEYVSPDQVVDLTGGFTHYVLNSEEPLLMNKNRFDSMLTERGVKLIGTTAESWLGVPLKTIDREVIGVIVVQSYDNPDAYTLRDRDILAIISTTIAQAIKYKQANEIKQELEAKLIRAEKMEALGRLAGGVAHDLNNVLSAIVSYPDLLLMNLPEQSPYRKPILTMQKSGQKAAAIVQDLLALARRGIPTQKVVNLNDLINDYLKSPVHEKLIDFHKSVSIKTVLEPNLFNIKGSPVHLSKTIMNLVSNAAESMPEGGEVSISTENRYVDLPIMGYDLRIDEGDYVVMKIIDLGVGISAADYKKIFEPFYTKKVMGRSGTGLGMAVVWGTVKDHRGCIDIKSKKGKGTAFSLYFPITRDEKIKLPPDLSFEKIKGNKEKILVVDDVYEQRDICRDFLETLDYEVALAESGEAAIEYIKGHKISLIVMDMIMDPGIDGLDTYREILKIHPQQKAIIVSGYAETERVKEMQQLGAGLYLRKPYTMAQLGIAIKNELRNKGKK
jgi:signal transduction histidine kinase/ActR/RegA family two-component response regulator